MTIKRLYTRAEAAAYLGLAPKTLENWQHQGKGPKHVKIGGRVNYDLVDLDAYIEAQKAAMESAA